MIQISRFFGQTEKLGIDWEWEILFVLSGSMAKRDGNFHPAYIWKAVGSI